MMNVVYICVCMCIPVSLSKERYQIWPSSDVLKWSSDHMMLKLSLKDGFDEVTEDCEQTVIKAAMKRREVEIINGGEEGLLLLSIMLHWSWRREWGRQLLAFKFFLQLEYQSLSRCTDDHKIMINWRKSGAYSILFFPLSKADMGILGIKL